jgi:hypothetical protein
MPRCRCGDWTDNEDGYCDECQIMILGDTEDDE